MWMLVALSVFGVTTSVVSTVAEAQGTASEEDGDPGFNDWGLFGLLGLTGLAGLRRNRNEHDNRSRGGRDDDDGVDVRRSPSSR